MSQTVLDEFPVTSSDIIEITREVWSSFLSLEIEPVDADSAPLEGLRITGVVSISGAWQGSVVLECAHAHAVAAAEAMFAADPGSLSDDEVGDALGELTNMVGGNVKSLLPAPSALSIPSVAEGDNLTVRVPGAVLTDRVALVSAAGLLHVSLWKV
jgi:chemotaxis protein CheX